MPFSRRQFIHRCSSVATLSAISGQHLYASSFAKGSGASTSPPITTRAASLADPELVRKLALQAIDAARQAGATYADVRLTRIVSQSFINGEFQSDRETVGIGVRTLVNGYWGFSASPFWEGDEGALLARDAVAQASANATGSARTVDMGTVPAIVNGTWTTPIRRDPFTIPLEEKLDMLSSIMAYAGAYGKARSVGQKESGPQLAVTIEREERSVATTDGSYFTQVLYNTGGSLEYTMQDRQYQGQSDKLPLWTSFAQGLTKAQGGWEIVEDANLYAQIPRLYAECDEQVGLPVKPVDVGRHTIVFDAASSASLVDQTIGIATELDRALGYEANAGGTSYLTDPVEMLGTYSFGTPLLTVTADRTSPGALATVKWDDEGVTPDTCTLVSNGTLTDFQTTREQATWLAPWYARQGHPVRSHGCAGADSALSIPMQHAPNLILAHGHEDVGLENLVSNTAKGFLMMRGRFSTDFQARNGFGSGILREIKNGKLGNHVAGGGVLFNTSELWKSLITIGGSRSAEWFAMRREKGQPVQHTNHSVRAVPFTAKEIAVIDPRRKA